MRMLFKYRVPTPVDPRVYSDGTIAKQLRTFLDPFNAEAVYYGDEDGKKTGWIFFDLSRATDITELAEGCALQARLAGSDPYAQFMPVFTPDELDDSLKGVSERLHALGFGATQRKR